MPTIVLEVAWTVKTQSHCTAKASGFIVKSTSTKLPAVTVICRCKAAQPAGQAPGGCRSGPTRSGVARKASGTSEKVDVGAANDAPIVAETKLGSAFWKPVPVLSWIQ